MNQTTSYTKIYNIFNSSKPIVIRFQAFDIFSKLKLAFLIERTGMPNCVMIDIYSFKKLLIRFLLPLILLYLLFAQASMAQHIKHKADSNCPFSKSILLEIIKSSIFIFLYFPISPIKKSDMLKHVGFSLVGEGGFGPPKRNATDLQSAPFGHSGTRPYNIFLRQLFDQLLIIEWWSWWTDLNPRPADYKSAALPTELHQHLSFLLPVTL